MSDPQQFTNTTDSRFTRWRKSSKSGGSESCLFVDDTTAGVVAVCDHKDGPDGPVHAFPRSAWAAFVNAVKAGSLG